MQRPSSSIRIVDAGPAQRDFIRALSAHVFSQFGDYETLLPGLLVLPWIRTAIAELEGEPVGFAMVSLEDRATGVIDLVAIAVDPEHQSRGVGRRLLAHVEAEALRSLRGRAAIVHLTVAEDNARAQELFRRSGYVDTGRGAGAYPRGQPSIELRKTVREKGGSRSTEE